jgi:tRNA(fMet)-specific endonuclease VapC
VKYLFDTDHISIVQFQSGPEFAALSARIAQHLRTDLAFSVVSFHEQVLGAHTYLSRARHSTDFVSGYERLGRLIADYAAFPVAAFDALAAVEFDVLVAQRVRIGAMDLRFASIALANGLTLLTRNVRHFGKVPGLAIEDWTI